MCVNVRQHLGVTIEVIGFSTTGVRGVAAKEVKFGGDGRQRMLRGVDILADA
jgi:hypothetical protein